MYSMISAPVLGFDLARMNGGANVAQVLACALRLDERGLLALGTLAAAHTQQQQAGVRNKHFSRVSGGGRSGQQEAGADQARLQAWLDLSRVTQANADGKGNLSGLSHMGVHALGHGSSPSEDDSYAEEETQTDEQEDQQESAHHVASTLARRAADGAAVAAVLEQAPLGSLDALLRCLREEIFDWVGPLVSQYSSLEAGLLEGAVMLVCDAAAAAYTFDVLPADAYNILWQPWQQAYQQLDAGYRQQGLGGSSIAFAVADTPMVGLSVIPHVRRLLDRLAAVDTREMRQMGQASARWRFRDPSWSTAVHDASWAVSLSGRTRQAALAQMLLVHACSGAQWPAASLAQGDWNTISGAVHALSVHDMVSSETLHRLIAACEEVFGCLTGPLDPDLPAEAG